MIFSENKTVNLFKEKFCVEPQEGSKTKLIYLTESKSAWITIGWLSEELCVLASKNYQNLFDLHPIQRGKLMMYDQEVNAVRWHQSYLKTPLRDSDLFKHKSYMYSGKENVCNATLPESLQVFLDFVNTNEIDKYNQVTANWYANGNDYIAKHSDCEIGLLANSGIVIITLCQDENLPRVLKFTPKKTKLEKSDNIYSELNIQLKHASIITMYGDTQKKFRHQVPKDLNNQTSRISLTFRKFM